MDYHKMMNEFRAIGTNLNQIAQKAHVLGVIDTKRYDSAVQMFIETLRKILDLMRLPEKVKN